ncbi:unnamed protein product [Cutaneotrichosporon oleaginosum]
MSQRSEWDVLKQHHRFVREDEEAADVSWEERLARAYESKLFKEYALIDLKHFKSKRFALRWRTATEVVEGLGEETCGSLRCAHHPSGSEAVDLKAFELPFVYVEDGERKEALVKVRLCTNSPGNQRKSGSGGGSAACLPDVKAIGIVGSRKVVVIAIMNEPPDDGTAHAEINTAKKIALATAIKVTPVIDTVGPYPDQSP